MYFKILIFKDLITQKRSDLIAVKQPEKTDIYKIKPKTVDKETLYVVKTNF